MVRPIAAADLSGPLRPCGTQVVPDRMRVEISRKDSELNDQSSSRYETASSEIR